MFILVECCDRNMELLGVHDKKTEAFENLESHLVSAMDLKEIPANWDQTPFKRDTDFGIDEDSGEFDDGMIEGFEYNLKDVIYSVAKINGKIVENFLMESLSGSSAEFSITATEIRKMLNLAADGWICEKIEENETLYIRFTKGKEEAEFELVKC